MMYMLYCTNSLCTMNISYLIIVFTDSLFRILQPLFSDEQYDDFESQIEKDYFGIGILSNIPFAFIEEVEYIDDISLVDETGEILGEILFLLRHVNQFFLPEIVHETFSEHVREIIKHTFLFFSSESSYYFAPFLEVVDIAHVGKSHEHDKHVQMLPVLIAGIEFLDSRIPVAMCDACDAMGILLL